MSRDRPVAQSEQTLRSLLQKREKSLQQVRILLGRAIDHLNVAAEGQDDTLDEVISELRQQMRSGLPTAMLVNQLGASSNTLSTIRRTRAEKQLRGFSDCIAQLLLLNPPADIRQELADFVKQARRLIARPTEQEILPIKFSHLQAKVLEAARDGQLAANGGAAGDDEMSAVVPQADIEELAIDDALDGLPPYTSIAETIDSILTDLLVQIRVPVEAQQALDKARQILSAGLNWYELAALLEQIAIVVIASLDTDQNEFEIFLQDLNIRLNHVNGGLEDIDTVTRELFCNGEVLDTGLRRGIDSIADGIHSAQSVDVLKASIQGGLDSVISQLDHFQSERNDIHIKYEEQVADLRARIAELEQQAHSANEEIQAQQRRSELDSLTELPNRSAYERRLDIEMERWQRYQQGFCLVIADIDHFKLVNDKYGHLAGDKVLRVVAKTLRKRLRRADFIARFGGEEFVILLPATDSAKALQLMEKLREQIRECPFHYNKDPLEITVSFGIAEVQGSDTCEALFERADKALYAAKDAGRDKCRVGGEAA